MEIEDLKLYFFDSFLSSSQFSEYKTGTAYSTKKVGEIMLSTGALEASQNMLSYNSISFNPAYSELAWKMRLSSAKDIKVFAGFRSNLTEPTLTMTESHAGIMIDEGKVYITSANGYSQQKAQIMTLDMTKFFEFKIKDSAFYAKPLPQIITYLGLPDIVRVKREWSLLQENSTYPAEDRVHYIMFFIKNKTNEEKFLYLNKVVYKEEYPD